MVTWSGRNLAKRIGLSAENAFAVVSQLLEICSAWSQADAPNPQLALKTHTAALLTKSSTNFAAWSLLGDFGLAAPK